MISFKPKILLSILVLTACTRIYSAPPTPTAIPSPTLEPISEPPPSPSPTNPPPSDTCLHGKWFLDVQNFTTYIAPLLSPEPQSQITLMDNSGELYLTFAPDGNMSLAAEAFKLNLLLEVEDSSFNATQLQLTIGASGSANYGINNGDLIVYNQDYNVNKQDFINVHVDQTSITLSPISLSPQFFFPQPVDDIHDLEFLVSQNTPHSSGYTCTSDILIIRFKDSRVISFLRANQ